MKTNTLVSSPNIEGNIGSCAIQSTNIPLDSWHTQTIAINSCTGKVVSQTSYFEWGGTLLVGAIILFILLIGTVLLKMIFD